MVYLGKITRAKRESREGFAEGEIPVGAVKVDLRTMGNTLSFWKCEMPPDDGIRAVALALATGADRIDRMDSVWVEEDTFHAHGIALNPSKGRTPFASLRGQHVDLIRLDLGLGRLAKVATLLAQALTQNQQGRFTRKAAVSGVLIYKDFFRINEAACRKNILKNHGQKSKRAGIAARKDG